MSWRQISRPMREIDLLMGDARRDFSLPDEWYDLFDFTYSTFIWLSKARKIAHEDTMYLVGQIMGIWEDIYRALPEEKAEMKMLNLILARLNSRVVDHINCRVYDFVISHFKAPSFMAKKKFFIESKMDALKDEPEDELHVENHLHIYINFLLLILSDEGAPIEEVEAYAVSHDHYESSVMLKIYRERGEREREMKLLQSVVSSKFLFPLEKKKYEMRLKAMYRQQGMNEEYNQLLETMFYEYPGDEDIYKEYRRQFTDEEWKAALKGILERIGENFEAMSFVASEKQYDCLMKMVEEFHNFGEYEEVLRKLYPDRALGIYVYLADEEMKNASGREGYRKVKKVLEKMLDCPGGSETASRLAEKYVKMYPRKFSLKEEMLRFYDPDGWLEFE